MTSDLAIDQERIRTVKYVSVGVTDPPVFACARISGKWDKSGASKLEYGTLTCLQVENFVDQQILKTV